METEPRPWFKAARPKRSNGVTVGEFPDDVKQFLAAEKLHQQRALEDEKRPVSLSDLKRFSKEFKLNTPVPKDLYSILGIAEEKEGFRAETSKRLDLRLEAVEHEEKSRMEFRKKKRRENGEKKVREAEEAVSSADKFTSKVTPTPNPWNLPPGTTVASRLFGSQGMKTPKEESNAPEVDVSAHKGEGSSRHMRGKVDPHTNYMREQYENLRNASKVASSIGLSRDGYQSSTTERTYSTRPTTVSDSRSSIPPFHKAMMAQNSIIEESELTTDRLTTLPQDVGDIGDGQSTISDDSVLLDPAYRDLIVKEFASALLQGLPSKHLLSQSRFMEKAAFRQAFDAFLKAYTKEVMEGTPRRSRRRQASKAIRRLRHSILLRLQEDVSDLQNPEMPGKIATTITRHVENAGLGEQTWKEKCSEWAVDRNDDGMNRDENQLPTFYGPEPPFFDLNLDHRNHSDGVLNDASISSTEQDGDEESTFQCPKDPSNISDPYDQDVYQYLTRHDAFSSLTRNIQNAMEQHLGSVMELIRHRVMLALRRPQMTEKVTDGVFRVSFRTEWDLVAFLKDQYPTGRMQLLRHMLALTGEAIDAQLTTVEKYLGQFWPKHTYRLVDTITSTISQIEGDWLSSDICFFPGKRTLTVLGSEELIVTVAQQFAWLGAACRASAGKLAFCYTTFSEVNDLQVEWSGPVFDVTYDVSSIGLEAIESCWHGLVGNSVIATGFPIPERNNGEVGLHVPLEIMASLAKIPHATRFCGGYVLKGRSIMLVPVDKKGTSIQWHLVQKQGRRRTRYRDLNVMYPHRLLFDAFEEEDLSSTNCFLGWCPQIKNYLATTDYNYRSVGYSGTPCFSKRTVSLTNISFGFQQWGTAGLQFALAKKDGYYHNQKSDFYEDMLDDAAQISVVLQDMEDRRAWLASAETMILHIILHRNVIRPFKGKGPTMDLQAGMEDDPLFVRQAMLSNRDVVIRRDRQFNEEIVTDKLFQHLVSELFTIFEGLEGVQGEIARESGKELKLGEPNRLHGWEYLDIVNRKRNPQIRSTDLKKTCGAWPKLMRELNAINLFGVRFNEAIQPTADRGLCSGFKTLPKGKDYLAMEVIKLQSLYEESGSYERGNLAQITLSGTQLQLSTHLFGPCSKINKRSKPHEERCTCERVQQLMFKKNDNNIAILQGETCSGAIIIGQGNASWRERFRGPKTNRLQAQSPRSQRSTLPPECALPKITTMTQATTIQQDTLPTAVSINTQGSASSSLYTQMPSSSGSGYMSGRSSAVAGNTIDMVNGKQTLRGRPNYPLS